MIRSNIKVTLDTRRLQRLRRDLLKAASKHVEVGFFGGKPHPADPSKAVATIAAIQEFGAPEANIPERPFMRATLRYHPIDNVVVNGVRSVIAYGAAAADYSLWARTGLFLQKAMSGAISNWSMPPNAPATVAKKGFDDALVETGHMRDSVEYRIR